MFAKIVATIAILIFWFGLYAYAMFNMPDSTAYTIPQTLSKLILMLLGAMTTAYMLVYCLEKIWGKLERNK